MSATSTAFETAQTQFAALTNKAVDLSEQNTKAAFAFAREALLAKSPEALLQAQTAFFKSQQESATKQFGEVQAFYADLLKQAPQSFADAFKPFWPAQAA